MVDNYPLLPVTPNFDDSWDTKTNTSKSSYGDGGVVSRGRKSPINRSTTSLGIGVNRLDQNTVDAFLVSRLGKPFRVSLDGGLTDDGRLYRAMAWDWELLGVGVASFSAELMQARRLTLDLQVPLYGVTHNAVLVTHSGDAVTHTVI